MKGVRRTIELRLDQTLVDLHQAIQGAFGWDDDHLYIFDFGDEWRVRITLDSSTPADGGPYPRIVRAVGEAPLQYPDPDDEGDE